MTRNLIVRYYLFIIMVIISYHNIIFFSTYCLVAFKVYNLIVYIRYVHNDKPEKTRLQCWLCLETVLLSTSITVPSKCEGAQKKNVLFRMLLFSLKGNKTCDQIRQFCTTHSEECFFNIFWSLHFLGKTISRIFRAYMKIKKTMIDLTLVVTPAKRITDVLLQ